MHAIHLESHRILLAALAALVLALVAAAAPSTLGELSASDGAPAAVSAADPLARAGTPAWVANPVASPIAALRGE